MRNFYDIVINQDYQCFIYLDWGCCLVILIDINWNGVILILWFFKVFLFLFVGRYVVGMFFCQVDIGVMIIIEFIYLFGEVIDFYIVGYLIEEGICRFFQ